MRWNVFQRFQKQTQSIMDKGRLGIVSKNTNEAFINAHDKVDASEMKCFAAAAPKFDLSILTATGR